MVSPPVAWTIRTTHPEPQLDPAAVTGAVDRVLSRFLAEKLGCASTPQLPLFVGWLQEFLAGGKRLRPLLCYCGWQVGGARGAPVAIARVAASLELFHAFALIHDDVMDDSATRRGKPSAHRRIAADNPGHRSRDRLGVNAAILLGDLALGWSYDLVATADLPSAPAAMVWRLLDAMRIETLSGQYLDLLTAGDPAADVETALAIGRYKTAKYTIERPLQIGAVLAGANSALLAACTEYAVPLGEAFQLRDDILAVFGDPAVTGKPNLDDLRDAKHTVLLAIARQRAEPAQAAILAALVGNPGLDEEGAARVRDVITSTGARATVEQMISDRCRQARTTLETAGFHPSGAVLLNHLISQVTDRDL
ncbi:polyprenyl synthetase family protein [Nocardia sp. NPDC005745]|uniref:polyprenyl synthetase family protein n=1 Tax=Nocardia sp. NPDC005745 TaxID=3157061 RepID=UPI0033EFA160